MALLVPVITLGLATVADESAPLTLVVFTVALELPSAEQPVMLPLPSSFKIQKSAL